MRAIVHIGLPKTGTSSFQQVLHEQLDALSSRGVHVLTYDGPDEQIGPPTRAFDLANCVVRTDLDAWWRTYMPESVVPAFVARGEESIRRQVHSPAELLVATVEDLFLMRTEAEIDRLVHLLAPRQVSIVCTVRDRDAWLDSVRQQLVRSGIRPYSRWSESCSNLEPTSWLCDMDGMLNLLKSKVGPDNVTVVDYDLELRERSSVLPALWSACDLPMDLLLEPGADRRWVNPTPLWAHEATPPPDVPNELEWLRGRVLEQAKEIQRMKRINSRRRYVQRAISRIVSLSRRRRALPKQ